MNFFVSSDKSPTGNLGGLAGADQRCQTLAVAVGRGSAAWHAYLSNENPFVNVIDRIGNGPYVNAHGAEVAANKAALHARAGAAELFLDETGNRINGQWQDSPTPNEHHILRGSNSDGSVKIGSTCGSWSSTQGASGVGHADGLGPNMDADPPRNSSNGAHEGDCGNTLKRGRSGKIYRFVAP